MIIKRLFDLVMGIIGLIILMPIILIVSLMIKIKMPNGPVFFIQKRVGKDGELFKMIKFRTMSVSHGGSPISIKGESRITKTGVFLRKYKLDELPGLLNVIKGDMSFVGPRPDVPGYADLLIGKDREILKIRPGITGPASMKYSNEEELLSSVSDPIKYNNEVIYPDKVRINLNYISNRSFWLDIKIIIYTVLGKNLKEPWAN